MAVVQRDDTISIICDADRGLVELFIGQTSYGLIVGPLLTGALLEANMLTLLSSPNVKSERLFVRGLVMLTPSTSAPRPAVTILPDLMSNTVSPFPVSPSSVIHASVSRLGIGPFSLFQLEDVDVVPAHDIQVGVPLHWSVTFSHALSTVIGRASATLIAACPESELEQHLAPWLLLPVLSNGPGNVSDEEQLLAQVE